MKHKNFLKLIISLIVPQLVGGIGAIFTVSAIPAWYATLQKPALSPPNWVFGPAWTILYLLMGVAVFLVWRKGYGRREIKIALIIFGIQMALNALWSVIFFGLQNPGAALVEIVLLWLSILATIIAFYKISKPAAALLAPYILWVSFAAYLNYAIWILN